MTGYIYGYAISVTASTSYGQARIVEGSYKTKEIDGVTYSKIIDGAGATLSQGIYNYVALLENVSLGAGKFYAVRYVDFEKLTDKSSFYPFNKIDEVSVNGVNVSGVSIFISADFFSQIPGAAKRVYYKTWQPSQKSESFALPVIDRSNSVVGWYPISKEAELEAMNSLSRSSVRKLFHFGAVPQVNGFNKANRTINAELIKKPVFGREIIIQTQDGSYLTYQNEAIIHYFQVGGQTIAYTGFKSDIEKTNSNNWTPNLRLAQINEKYNIVLPNGVSVENAVLESRSTENITDFRGSIGYSGFTPQVIDSSYARQIRTSSSGTPSGWAPVSTEAKEKFEYYFNNEVIETPTSISTKAFGNELIIVTNTTGEEFTVEAEKGFENRVKLTKTADAVYVNYLKNENVNFSLTFKAKNAVSTTQIRNIKDNEQTALAFGYLMRVTGETYNANRKITAEFVSAEINGTTYTKMLSALGKTLTYQTFNWAAIVENDTLPAGTFYAANRGSWNTAGEAAKQFKVLQPVDISLGGTQVSGKTLWVFNESSQNDQKIEYLKFWAPSVQDDPSFALPVVNDESLVLVGWYPVSEAAKKEAQEFLAGETAVRVELNVPFNDVVAYLRKAEKILIGGVEQPAFVEADYKNLVFHVKDNKLLVNKDGVDAELEFVVEREVLLNIDAVSNKLEIF